MSEPATEQPLDDEWDQEYDDEEPPTCEYCGGNGGDPMSDYLFECEHCDGEGYKWWLA